MTRSEEEGRKAEAPGQLWAGRGRDQASSSKERRVTYKSEQWVIRECDFLRKAEKGQDLALQGLWPGNVAHTELCSFTKSLNTSWLLEDSQQHGGLQQGMWEQEDLYSQFREGHCGPR